MITDKHKFNFNKYFELFHRFLSKGFVNYFLVLLIMVIFSFPNILKVTPIFRYLRISQSLLTLLSIIIWAIYFRKNKYINFLMAFFVSFLLITIFRKGSIDSFIFYFTNCFGWVVISNILFRHNKRAFLHAISDYFFVMIVLHLITSLDSQLGILFEESVNNEIIPLYFFGKSNQLTFLVLSYFTSIVVSYFILEDGLYKFIIGGIASILSILLAGSSTGILGLFIFSLAVLYAILFAKESQNVGRKEGTGLVVSFVSILSVVILNLSLVVFRAQKLLDSIIKAVFKKDATFSTRTGIWDMALLKIKEKLVFGYGAIEGRYIYIFETANYFDPHNLFLDLMFKGGLITTSIFLILCFISIYSVFKIHSKKIRIVFLGFFVSFFVMSLTEVYSYSMIFWILFLPFLVTQYFSKNNDEEALGYSSY